MAINAMNPNMLSVVGPSFVQSGQALTPMFSQNVDMASLSSTGMPNLTGLSSYLNGDNSAFKDYMNSSYAQAAGSLSSGADGAGIAQMAQASLDALGDKAKDVKLSDTGKALSGARTSYFKQHFPNMSDEQIATLNKFYDAQYAQYEEQMGTFMNDLCKAMGIDPNSLTAGGVAGSGAISASSANMQGTAWGKALAQDAEANANGPGGWCLKWVAQALGRHGVNIGGASAYMAADQLANCSQFNEVSGLSDADLRSLPAGAVVVWNRGNGHEHGHICISLGDGREASDKIRNMTQNYGTSFRVFMPK